MTISATVTDSAGNSSTQTHNVQVNTAAVSLSVSTISGDNIINAAEAGSALTLIGTGTNFAAGTVVTVLLNGKGYSATIQNNGSLECERAGGRRRGTGGWHQLHG